MNKVYTQERVLLETTILGDDVACRVKVTENADGTATLEWDDCIANEWVEIHPSVPQALARLVVLWECAMTGFDQGFAHDREEFGNDYLKFVKGNLVHW